MRLPQFAFVLVSAIVAIVALGSVSGLDTVEVVTMSLVIAAVLTVQFVRQARLRLDRE